MTTKGCPVTTKGGHSTTGYLPANTRLARFSC